jgi:cell division protein FtsQ
MPVTAPTDKRFLRAQVRPPRKRRAWRRLVVLGVRLAVAVAVLAFVGYRVSAVVGDTGMLRIHRIVIRGSERASNGEILALLEGLRGQNILFADLDGCRGRLLESPWVSDAVLRRRLPSTVEVVIAERRPMGIARLQGELYLIDDQGTVIEEYGPKYAELDLPIIDGLAGTRAGKRAPLDERRVVLAAQLLAALTSRPDLVRRISQIDVKDPRNAVVILEEDTALLRLGDSQFLERLQLYLDLAPALHERVPAIDYVDLRFGEHVYVGAAGHQQTVAGPKVAPIHF